MPLKEDRDLVVAYLHAAGSRRDILTDGQAWTLYCMGDGFGSLAPGILSGINGGWDWSHVADSSREALARMALWLRERGFALDSPTGLRATGVEA